MRLWHRELLGLVGAAAVGAAALAATLALSDRSMTLGALPTLVALAALALLARALSHGVSGTLADLTRLTQALVRGERARRPRTASTAELRTLALELAELAEHLDREVVPLKSEQTLTAEILGAMSNGVLLLDAGGRVVRANPAAVAMLGMPSGDVVGESIVRVARAFPAVSLAERALRAREPIETQVEMPSGDSLHVQSMALHAVTHPGTADGPAGPMVLMVIRDETDRVRTDRLRRDFAANVSHELKTPLAGITLLADTLTRAMDDDPEQARVFVRRLAAEVAGLTNLVIDLLTLSRLEEREAAGASRETPVDLGEVVRASAARSAERARARGITLEATVPGGVTVTGNPVDLETLVRNLLDNAIRFTDPGGHVWVTLDETETEALLSVRDDGIGIPKDDRSRVFERFYRVDRARSRETGGTGLGLSIVRHVAEGHGGRVDLESTVGVGSTFTVRLPLADPGSAGPRDAVAGSGSGKSSGDGDVVALQKVDDLG